MRGGFGKGMFRFSSGKGYGNHGHNLEAKDKGTVFDTGEFRSVLFRTLAQCAKPRSNDVQTIKDPAEIFPGVKAGEAINIAMLGCVFFAAMLICIGGCFVLGWVSDMKRANAAQAHTVNANGKTPGIYQQQYAAQQQHAVQEHYAAQQAYVARQQYAAQQQYAAHQVYAAHRRYAAHQREIAQRQYVTQQNHGQYAAPEQYPTAQQYAGQQQYAQHYAAQQQHRAPQQHQQYQQQPAQFAGHHGQYYTQPAIYSSPTSRPNLQSTHEAFGASRSAAQ